MNAIDLLTKQHREAEALFDQVISAEGAERLMIFEQLALALTIHATIEEQIFYPACKKAGVMDLLEEALEEHQRVKKMLDEMISEEEDGLGFGVKARALKYDVLHHVKEEEKELFPKVKQTLANELDGLGEQMMKLADRLVAGGRDPVENLAIEKNQPASI